MKQDSRRASRLVILVGISALAAVPAWPQASTSAGSSSLSVTLTPLADSDGQPTQVKVTVRVVGPAVETGEPVVQLPLVYGNMITAAKKVQDLNARDLRGDLPLSIKDVGQGPAGQRSWLAGRPTQGPITLTYRVPAMGETGANGAGTPVELRPDGRAVSGSASTFLLLPPGERSYRFELAWDLSAMAKGSRALSSFGAGNVHARGPVPLASLRTTYFMAGAIGAEPTPPTPGGFNSAWQGKVPFPVDQVMRWSRTLYDHYSHLYGTSPDDPYSIFVRYNPVNAGGGAGQYRSFIVTYGDQTTASEGDQLKFVVAHEMYHTFQPQIAAVPGTMSASWFNEGTAVYYGWMLPYRYGLGGGDYVLEQVNKSAMRYYTSIKFRLSNDDVARNFWADTRIRMLAYDRGAFYFAIVDKAIRKASGNKRSLDDLMRTMRARQSAGQTLQAADWEALIGAELGPSAVADYRAMLAGALQLPDSDTFGPCFRRTSAMLRRYELGFDPNVLIEPDRIVRGLVPGSEAEKAGLRNGDRLVKPVPQDIAASSQTLKLTYPVRRGDTQFVISYLPRGEAVETPQWERVPDADRSRCPR